MIPYFEISKLVLKGRDMVVRRDDPLSSISFGVRMAKSQQDLAIDFDAYEPIEVFHTFGTYIGISDFVLIEGSLGTLTATRHRFPNTPEGWMEFLTIVALFRNETAIKRYQEKLYTFPQDAELFDIPVGDVPSTGWYKNDDTFLFVPDFSAGEKKLILMTPIVQPLKYSDYLLDIPIPSSNLVTQIDKSFQPYHPYARDTLLMAGAHTILTGDAYMDAAILLFKIKPWIVANVNPSLDIRDSYHYTAANSTTPGSLFRKVSIDFFHRLFQLSDKSISIGATLLNRLKEKGLIQGWKFL